MIKKVIFNLEDMTNMNGSELDKNHPTLQFEGDEDTVKMLIFYFIKLMMISRERRQYIDWTMLGLIDD